MLNKVIFTLVLFACFSFALSKNAHAESTVRSLNFNIGTYASNDLNLTPEQRTSRMIKLADFIKDESIEVAFVQEFWLGANDLQDLLSRLNQIGYPMYSDVVYYEQFKPNAGALLLLSKYPFDQASKQVSYEIRHNRSAQSIVVRNTPIGWFRVSNIHTHVNEPCRTFDRYIFFYYQLDKTNNLLAGDINLFLNKKPLGTNAGRDGSVCVGINYWDDINISCTTNVCHDNGIEWFILPKVSDLYIKSHVRIPKDDPRLQISDSHAAFIAEIGSVNPKFDPTPTPFLSPTPSIPTPSIPTPSIAPSPSPVLKHDTNRDGKVDILDVFTVLKYMFK